MARASSASYCSALVPTFILSLGIVVAPLDLRLARGGRPSRFVSEVLMRDGAGSEMVGMVLKSKAVAINGNAKLLTWGCDSTDRRANSAVAGACELWIIKLYCTVTMKAK